VSWRQGVRILKESASRGQQGEKGRYLSRQMSARVGKGPIGVSSAWGIEWYRSLSVRMPVVPSSQQFGSTCPWNSSTMVWITFQPAVAQHRDSMPWNPPLKGNRMANVSQRPHRNRGQQDEKGRYLSGKMSTRVGKGLIGVLSPRGIEWYRSRSVRISIEVSRMKKADSPGGRCPPESGNVSLESARRGEWNGIGLELSTGL